jgi:2-keto-4-pentenoate hydratase
MGDHQHDQRLSRRAFRDALSIGRALVEARRCKCRLPASDLAVPPNLEAAAAAQSVLFRGSGHNELRPVAGWKVAIGPGGVPVSAPLHPLVEAAFRVDQEAPGASMRAAEATSTPWREGMAFEIEIAVRLGSDLPPRPGRRYDRAEIVDAVETVYAGLEIIDSRLDEGSQAPFPLFMADWLGNSGYVVGAVLRDCLEESFGVHDLSVTADGKSLFSRTVAHPNADPLAPLIAYSNRPLDALGGLKAGQIVTTGSLCGVLPLTSPRIVEAFLDGRKVISVKFVGSSSHV